MSNWNEQERQIKPSMESVLAGIPEGFVQVIQDEPSIATTIQPLWNRAEMAFGDDEWKVDAVCSTTRLATVAHQQNERDNKQRRKTTGEPYITHPVAIAHSLLGESPYPDIPAQYLARTYDVELVLTALMHDVAEDVRYRGVSGKEWLDVLDTHLGQYEAFAPGIAARVRRNVNALTDFGKIDDMPQEVHDTLLESEIVRSRAQELARMPGMSDDVDEHKEASVQAMGAIVRIFQVADECEDPAERLRTLASCLTVKAHDVLNNLGDGMMTGYKVARALELAAISRYMGSDASTALLMRLAPLYDLGSPDDGLLRPSNQSALAELHAARLAQDDFLLTDGQRPALIGLTPVAELPVLTHSEVSSEGPNVRFGVQLRFQANGIQSALSGNEQLHVQQGTNGEHQPMAPIDVPIHEILRSLGRDVAYYKLPSGVIVKLMDGQPTVCDTLTTGHATADILSVPESALLSPTSVPGSQIEGSRPRTIQEIVDSLEIMSPLPNSQNSGRRVVTFPGTACGDNLAHTALI